MPLSYALPTQIVTAWPQEQDGEPGYAVLDINGTKSWSPKEVVDKTWLPLGYIDHLAPHEQRLVAHVEQMVQRTEQLEGYMETQRFADLVEDDQDLIHAQFDIMNVYLGVLRERIEQSPINEKEDQDDDDSPYEEE
jgi:hypothetical protein